MSLLKSFVFRGLGAKQKLWNPWAPRAHAPIESMSRLSPMGPMGGARDPPSLLAADLGKNASWKKVMCPMLKSAVLLAFSDAI